MCHTNTKKENIRRNKLAKGNWKFSGEGWRALEIIGVWHHMKEIKDYVKICHCWKVFCVSLRESSIFPKESSYYAHHIKTPVKNIPKAAHFCCNIMMGFNTLQQRSFSNFLDVKGLCIFMCITVAVTILSNFTLCNAGRIVGKCHRRWTPYKGTPWSRRLLGYLCCVPWFSLWQHPCLFWFLMYCLPQLLLNFRRKRVFLLHWYIPCPFFSYISEILNNICWNPIREHCT